VQPSPTKSLKANAATVLAAFIFVGAAAALSVALLRPPPTMPETAAPSEFSSARAMKHLREVARAPHPVGSDEHARVREYLLRELSALGVAPEVQETIVVQKSSRPGGLTTICRVRNVVARMKGSSGEERKALMLAAHYDSVPTAPGATDDGAGVATLLETLRALKAGEPVANDVIFLFSDAEELGLLGARGFADEHAWMRDIGLVLNFEGRGNSGPSMMFETSKGNARLIEGLAGAPHVIANSLMHAVYERMPNDTDMTVFKREGAAGLNFAYANQITHYHTALDNVDEVDERSIQHHGSYALALAQHFGNSDLNDLRASDAVYFNALGSLFVHYPVAWVWPLTIVAFVAYVAVLIAGLRRRILTILGVVIGVLTLMVGALLAGLITSGAGWVAQRLHRGFEFLPWGEPYNAWIYEIGFVLLTVALLMTLYVLISRRVNAASLLAGALLCWLVLLILTSVFLPPGSFLFLWPLIFATVGLAVVIANGDGGYESIVSIATAALCAIPGIVLAAPLIHLFFVMLGLRMGGLFMVLVVLVLGLVSPLFSTRGIRLAPAALAASGALFIGIALATGTFDVHRRKANSVFYHLDGNTAEARWLSGDDVLDEWPAQFFSSGASKQSLADIFPWSTQEVWRAVAPAVPLTAPFAEIAKDETSEDIRRVVLKLTPARRVTMLLVHVDPATEIVGASYREKTLRVRDEASSPLRLAFAAPPPEGVELTLEARAGKPLKLTVQDVSYELPSFPGKYAPRPADTMPVASFRASDTTVVGKSFTF
jgi:hypothetical protein